MISCQAVTTGSRKLGETFSGNPAQSTNGHCAAVIADLFLNLNISLIVDRTPGLKRSQISPAAAAAADNDEASEAISFSFAPERGRVASVVTTAGAQ